MSSLTSNLQLIACAGAGKTQRVAERVVDQLALDGTKPENVVAFTFNERAAAELKDRIGSIFESRHRSREGLSDLYVGTIHGYCLELLQRHSFDALSYNLLDDVQQRLFISRACKKVGLTEILGWQPYYDAKTFAELMAILREGDVDLPKLEGTPAGECLDRYCNRLAETRYFDFTAIMSEAVALLEEDQGFRGRVRDQVRYLTVDEYQDVNPLQERLVLQLADLGAKVTVVGDDDQLLYGWRGSSISNILTFAERHPKVVIDRLEANFRSSRGIVDLAREVIARNDPDRLTKKMVSAGNQAYEEGDIEMPGPFGDPGEEGSHIAARIGELVGTPFRDQPDAEERGLAFNDIAILVRVKRLIPAIVDALETHQIPTSSRAYRASLTRMRRRQHVSFSTSWPENPTKRPSGPLGGEPVLVSRRQTSSVPPASPSRTVPASRMDRVASGSTTCSVRSCVFWRPWSFVRRRLPALRPHMDTSDLRSSTTTSASSLR